MKKHNLVQKALAVLLGLAIIFGMASCGAENALSDDIVVLFTNDVHCGIDDDIGYAGLSAYKKEMTEKYRYVTLVDCGDFSQGGFEASTSQGKYLVELMNAVGYDFAVIGNHEFDYGMEQLENNIKNSDARFLNCNVTYTGTGENWIARDTKPYEIVRYGRTKVAFIGVSTPWSISSSSPLHFMEDGRYVYDFCNDENGHRLYDTVQKTVDECLAEGADYVIALCHLGMDVEGDTPFSSYELAENTRGIDVILDGHSHTEATCRIRKNQDGEDVLLSSTGTKLNNIGQLILTQNGTASVGYIEEYAAKDAEIVAKINEMRADSRQQMEAVVAHSNVSLSCNDTSGIQMVRSREVAIGDLVADAYRVISNADIGICNGGGIRADIKAGPIKYQDIIAVNPFGNTLCVAKVTGAEILDMLEFFCCDVQPDYQKDGNAWGENGNFPQVSGIRFSVDTSISGTVETDDADNLLSVSGDRRISDVEILRGDEYVPIDPTATYTLASQNYLIKNGGCGMLYFLAGHELIVEDGLFDYQLLINYIQSLNGDLSRYETVDRRITVK